MKKRLCIVMTLLCLLPSIAIFAQTDTLCGFDRLLQNDPDAIRAQQMHLADIRYFRQHGNLQTLPNGATFGQYSSTSLNSCRKAKYLIPVVVHIIHDSADSSPGTGTNISDAQVESALRILNARFANDDNISSPAVNTGIQFFLVNNGITRTASNLTRHRCPQDVNNLMALNYLDHTKYLNIWVVKEILDTLGQSTGILGYATMPQSKLPRHGIVMNYQRFGNVNDCSGCNLAADANGVVLAHEAGHFLGLYHPFAGGCAGNDSLSCSVQGDLCCDVPPVSGQNVGCGGFGRNTCYETPDFPDQVQNYMDYSGESCQNTFTADQTEIMQAVLNSSRNYLASPANLNTTGIQGCHKAATFTSNIEYGCLATDTFYLAGTYYATATRYRWYFYRNDTLIRFDSTTTQNYLFSTNSPGEYTIKLTILFSASNDSVSFVRDKYIEVGDCGPNLPNPQASWAFGYYGGLQFTTGGVKMNISTTFHQPDNVHVGEGSVSQANANGQMLFYAAGYSWSPQLFDSVGKMALYNKEYARMLNSGNIYGDESSTQGALFIPFPNNGARYYFVAANTSDYQHTPTGLRYSVIDTTLDGGKGGIVATIKNIPILGPSFIHAKGTDSSIVPGESITAVPQCNNRDYWLILTSSAYSNETYRGILVYSVTASGISYHSSYATNKVAFIMGQLKASPNGRFLAGYGQVFHFDRENGNVTGIFFGDSTLPQRDTLNNGYGHSFSPDSKLLYIEDGKNIYQYNLMGNNPVATRKLVGIKPEPEPNFSSLQLGPDNKLYCARWYSRYLSVIERPNARDTVAGTCGYKENGPRLYSLANSMWGLPNMIDAKKITAIPKSFDFAVKNCNSIQLFSTIHCASSYKWYFGDGDSSSLKDPAHTYVYGGTYTIRLVTPDTTVVRSVKIGALKAAITGDSVFCDTPSTLFFNAARNADYAYQWTVTNGGTFASSSTGEEVSVNWRDEGQVKLIVKDLQTGCTDSVTRTISRRIPPIVGNSIGSNQYACTASNLVKITGSKATGGAGTIGYQWRKKQKNLEWEIIPGATDTAYLPPLEDSTLYVRVAQSGGCEIFSNVVVIRSKVKNNQIIVQKRACIPGQTFEVNGSLPTHDSDTSFTYLWEYSSNGTTWNNVPPADTNHLYYDSQNLSWNYKADSVYLRRKVFSYPGYCTLTSNQIKLYPKIYIRQQPRDTIACGPNGPYYFGVSVVNETDSTVQYDWQFKSNGNATPFPENTATDDSSSITWATSVYSSPGDSFRCRIITPCGNFATRVATLYINHGTPQFATHPVNTSLVHGSSATFTCGLDNSANRYGLRYYWQVSYDDGESWQFIPGANDSFYHVAGVTWCMNKTLYRAVVFNGCSGYRFSNSALLTVGKPNTAQGDLVMRDALDDNGTEPYAHDNIWDSPDIWFSRDSSRIYDINRNDIEYKLHDSGYVKVKIHNKSAQTSSSYKVVLHWTKASTQEIWTKHWLATADNRFINNIINSPFYQDTFFVGGVIDTVTIPSIAAFDSTILVTPWYVPNPAWYGINGHSQRMMVCLLARILECNEKPYGMTYPERLVTADNVRNNKKIVTKNLFVVDTASSDWSVPIHTGNYWDAASSVMLNLKARNCNYFTYGEVVVSLDDALSAAWVAGGQQGTGITILDDHHVRIKDSCDAWLTGIAFAPNERGTATVRFVTDESHERTTFMDFDFDLWQYNEDSMTSSTLHPEGGMHIGCQLPTNTALHVLDNYIEPIDGVPYYAAVCPWATPPLLTGSSAVTPAYWSFQWQQSTDTLNPVGWVDIAGATDKDYQPTGSNIDMYYRRKAIKQYTLLTLLTPAVHIRVRDPHITQQPADAWVNEGDPATFTVSYMDMNVIGWQRNHSSGISNIDVQSATLNHVAEYCQDGQTFNARLQDMCTLQETSSGLATLHVTASGGNLWAQDNTSGSYVWNSPDIVNRRSNDNGTTHETPQYGSTNYLYVTVRNNGTTTSVPAKLHLYWTAATTGGKWDRNYRFDTTQSETQGNWTTFNGAKTGLGNLIGVYTIPAITSGGNTRIMVSWNPPDPMLLGNPANNDAEVGFVARLVTCSDAPYDMQVAENYSLGQNVRSNERVITKTYVVTPVIPGNEMVHPAGNANAAESGSVNGKLVWHTQDCDYFRYGYVLLHLDATMQSIWSNTNGSGYTVLNDSTLRIDTCTDALLHSIGYSENQRAQVGVEFVIYDTATVSSTTDLFYNFILEQFMAGDDDNSVGGIEYGVPIHLEPPATESFNIQNPAKQKSGETSFRAYPNPFAEQLNLWYSLAQDEPVTICLYNLLGQQVTTISKGSMKSAGSHRLVFNTEQLAEGVYFISFKAGAFTETKKVVLVR